MGARVRTVIKKQKNYRIKNHPHCEMGAETPIVCTRPSMKVGFQRFLVMCTVYAYKSLCQSHFCSVTVHNLFFIL